MYEITNYTFTINCIINYLDVQAVEESSKVVL